jgi:carbonic anhydrase
MTLTLVPVRSDVDLLEPYRQGPVAALFRYHERGAAPRTYPRPPLLVVTCMDWRIHLRMPPTFAYVIRTAGANVTSVLFNVDFAVSVVGVEAIALVAHDDCAMAAVRERRPEFERGLVAGQGWTREDAGEAFEAGVSWFAIDDPVSSAWSSAQALRKRYPNVVVAPLHYRVEDGRLTLVVDDGEGASARRGSGG